MFCDDILAMVLDIGHQKSTIGYVGEEGPKYYINSHAGVPNNQTQIPGGIDYDACLFGENMNVNYKNMDIAPLLVNEKYTDFNLLEKMMGFMFDKIYAQVENSPILMTDQNTQSDDKKKLVEIAFEQYETPAFFTCKKSVLSLFANGKTSGMVIESGSDSTQAVPISDGFVLHKNMYTLPIGGEYTTKKILESVEGIHLKNEVAPLFDLKMTWENRERKETLYQPMDGVSPSVRLYHRLAIARDIKESCCKIYTNKHEIPNDTFDYELPDGQTIQLGEERFHIPESIYMPSTRDGDGFISKGLSKHVLEVINKCDMDLRKDLLGNIIIVGGNSLVPGFVERFEKSLYEIAPQNTKVKIFAFPKNFERKFSSWLGGSILASTGSFQNLWIGKFEYEESGPNIVDRKCG